MSISDIIVVMKQGRVQQIGKPQDVYDSPDNLFVAKFLGTPPINVFDGQVRAQKLYIGKDCVLEVKGVADRDVFVGIRPEGFVPAADGELSCSLKTVEVTGRDRTVVSTHPNCSNVQIRSIVDAQTRIDTAEGIVRFHLRPSKVHLFHRQTEERIAFLVGEENRK